MDNIYYIESIAVAREHARKLAYKRHMPHYVVRWQRGFEVVAQIDMYYNRLSDSEVVKP